MTALTAVAVWLAPSQSTAADAWTLSSGITHRNVHVDQPGLRYKQESSMATAMAYRSLGNWALGGNVAYDTTKSSTPEDSGRYRPDTTTGGAFAMLELSSGLFGDVAVNYGNSILDASRSNGITIVAYSNKTKFLTHATGLTQAFHMDSQLAAHLSARYTAISSRTDEHTDGDGIRVLASSRDWNYWSIGGSLHWQSGDWRTSAMIDWLRADKEFIAGTSDREHFTLNLGLGIQMTPRTLFAVHYGTALGKAYVRQNSVGLRANHQF